MLRNSLTEVAQRASERYVSFLQGLRGLLSVVLRRSLEDVRSKSELSNGAFELARTYLATERDLIEMEVERAAYSEFARGSGSFSEASEFVEDLIESYIEALETEIRAQIERDIQQTIRYMRDFQIQAQLVRLDEGVNRETAQFRVLLRERSPVRFYFRDRAGRKYPAQKFIRTMWRDTLLQVGNEAFIVASVETGKTNFVVRHPDRGASADGVEFAATTEAGLPVYSDIRDEIFHPNSGAWIENV